MNSSDNKPTVTPIVGDTYLAVIKNSVGSAAFRNNFALVNGKKEDITRDGKLSCVFFVSSVLLTFGFIKRVHATVEGLIKDLEGSGWTETNSPKAGCILIWGPGADNGNEIHKHAGFYIGGNQAVSNSTMTGTVQQHHWEFKDKSGDVTRKVVKIFRNPKLI